MYITYILYIIQCILLAIIFIYGELNIAICIGFCVVLGLIHERANTIEKKIDSVSKQVQDLNKKISKISKENNL